MDKLAVLMLVSAPVLALVAAWSSMYIKNLPPPKKLTDEEAEAMLLNAMVYWEQVLIALEKPNSNRK